MRDLTDAQVTQKMRAAGFRRPADMNLLPLDIDGVVAHPDAPSRRLFASGVKRRDKLADLLRQVAEAAR